MTQEDKDLLLRDLCARLTYNVWCQVSADGETASLPLTLPMLSNYMYGKTDLKPYLRPMSSMTDEEETDLIGIDDDVLRCGSKGHTCILSFEQFVFLNSHHFDYRGLIEKGLALEAPEGMYEK